MFYKVLLNFWKDSEPEMSTISSSNTVIAGVARMYAKGIVDLLTFVFTEVLPPRAIIRILITAYLLTRAGWFLLGDAAPLPQTVFGGAVLAAALTLLECVVNVFSIAMLTAVEQTRWRIAQSRSVSRHNNGPDRRQALVEEGNQKLAQLFRNLAKMPGPVEDPDRWN
jgi:hypothetical protein